MVNQILAKFVFITHLMQHVVILALPCERARARSQLPPTPCLRLMTPGDYITGRSLCR